MKKIMCARLPALPAKGKSIKYVSKRIELEHEDGTIANYVILPSRSSAGNFIVNELWNMNFPMASPPGSLARIDYTNDPDYYREMMESWENTPSNFDEDTATYFYARGKFYSLNQESTLEDAISIYRQADNVERLLHINSSEAVLYNGIIMMDESYGLWTEDIDLPDGWKDYEWKNIHGTLIEVYPRESEEG